MIAFALPLLKKGLGLIPWAKVALYLLGAVVALFMYLTWKHNIEQASLAKFNADQMQELVKNQKEIKEKLQAFDELQQKYYENAEQYRKDLEKKLLHKEYDMEQITAHVNAINHSLEQTLVWARNAKQTQ